MMRHLLSKWLSFRCESLFLQYSNNYLTNWVKITICLDKTGDEDTKKAAAQFDALEKGDDLPEKEPIKA